MITRGSEMKQVKTGSVTPEKARKQRDSAPSNAGMMSGSAVSKGGGSATGRNHMGHGEGCTAYGKNHMGSK